jgi:hypothetical protein
MQQSVARPQHASVDAGSHGAPPIIENIGLIRMRIVRRHTNTRQQSSSWAPRRRACHWDSRAKRGMGAAAPRVMARICHTRRKRHLRSYLEYSRAECRYNVTFRHITRIASNIPTQHMQQKLASVFLLSERLAAAGVVYESHVAKATRCAHSRFTHAG